MCWGAVVDKREGSSSCLSCPGLKVTHTQVMPRSAPHTPPPAPHAHPHSLAAAAGDDDDVDANGGAAAGSSVFVLFFFQYGFSRGGERKNKGQGRFTSRSKHRHVNALKTTPVFVEMLLAASPFPRATAFQLFRPSEHRPDRANAIISRLKLNNSRISRLCPPRRRSRKKKKKPNWPAFLGIVGGGIKAKHTCETLADRPRARLSTQSAISMASFTL